MQLVPADVIERLFLGAVFVDLPREEVIDARGLRGCVSRQQIAPAAARLGKDLRRGSWRRAAFASSLGIVERAVGVLARVGVRLLIALQVIPAREDHAAEAVDDRREHAGRRVIEEEQLAGRRIEAPQAGRRRRRLVFVELRIEVPLRRCAADRT